jgi:hypothetical protein
LTFPRDIPLPTALLLFLCSPDGQAPKACQFSEAVLERFSDSTAEKPELQTALPNANHQIENRASLKAVRKQ